VFLVHEAVADARVPVEFAARGVGTVCFDRLQHLLRVAILRSVVSLERDEDRPAFAKIHASVRRSSRTVATYRSLR
jgi:hypothetical protein